MPLTHERLYSTGTLIRKLREEKGISLSEFARENGIKKQTIYKYERDIIKNINYDMIKVFADALNVNPAYLVGWSDVKDRVPEMGLTSGSKNTDVIIKEHLKGYSVTSKETEDNFTSINLGE